MANLAENYMPYAPTGSVLTVLKKVRSTGSSDVLDNRALTRMGISEGNAGRTLAALQFIGFIDEDGRKTEPLVRLEKAKTDEYPKMLGEIIRDAYSEVFKYLDPATATDVEFLDAFRGYEPAKQRTRMITLFIGLCKEAGIIEGGPPAVQIRKTRPIQKNNVQTPKGDNQDNSEYSPPPANTRQADINVDYAILRAFFEKLPTDQKWTTEKRDKWLKGLTSALDVEIEIVDEVENES